jgi:hypothetical protein
VYTEQESVISKTHSKQHPPLSHFKKTMMVSQADQDVIAFLKMKLAPNRDEVMLAAFHAGQAERNEAWLASYHVGKAERLAASQAASQTEPEVIDLTKAGPVETGSVEARLVKVVPVQVEPVPVEAEEDSDIDESATMDEVAASQAALPAEPEVIDLTKADPVETGSVEVRPVKVVQVQEEPVEAEEDTDINESTTIGEVAASQAASPAEPEVIDLTEAGPVETGSAEARPVKVIPVHAEAAETEEDTDIDHVGDT